MVLAVVASVLLPLRADSRVPAELATSQWQRLTARMARAAEQVRSRRGRPAATRPEVSAAAAAATSPAAATVTAIPAQATKVDPPSAPDGVQAAPWQRPPAESDSEVLARQATEYDAHRTKSVIELQKFRRTYTTRIADARGRVGRAELIDLNPRIGAWYLLQLTWDGGETSTYHLTNSRPETHRLILDSSFPGGLLLEGDRGRTECDLWSSDSPSSLVAASRLSTPYVTLCDDEVVLRRPTAGRRTSLEWATDFLRDNLWGGEALTVLVRDKLYSDAHLVTSVPVPAAVDPPPIPASPGLPRPARIDADHADDLLTPVDLGLELDSPRAVVRVGAWYPARDNSGVFVSVIESGLVARTLLESSPRRAGRLDAVEAVALDLSRRVRPSALRARLSPGHRPSAGRLVREGTARDARRRSAGTGRHRRRSRLWCRTGIVGPIVGRADVATLRRRLQALARRLRVRCAGACSQHGSHYGFIENGVVLSKLQPGLATIFALDDGAVRMKTWSRDDDALLERIRFARQNGVPIVETDAATGRARSRGSGGALGRRQLVRFGE